MGRALEAMDSDTSDMDIFRILALELLCLWIFIVAYFLIIDRQVGLLYTDPWMVIGYLVPIWLLVVWERIPRILGRVATLISLLASVTYLVYVQIPLTLLGLALVVMVATTILALSIENNRSKIGSWLSKHYAELLIVIWLVYASYWIVIVPLDGPPELPVYNGTPYGTEKNVF